MRQFRNHATAVINCQSATRFARWKIAGRPTKLVRSRERSARRGKKKKKNPKLRGAKKGQFISYDRGAAMRETYARKLRFDYNWQCFIGDGRRDAEKAFFNYNGRGTESAGELIIIFCFNSETRHPIRHRVILQFPRRKFSLRRTNMRARGFRLFKRELYVIYVLNENVEYFVMWNRLYVKEMFVRNFQSIMSHETLITPEFLPNSNNISSSSLWSVIKKHPKYQPVSCWPVSEQLMSAINSSQ